MLSIWNVLTNILNGEIVNLYKKKKTNKKPCPQRERKKGTFFMNRSKGWWKNKIFLSCLVTLFLRFRGGGGLGEVVLLVSACTIHTYFCRSCVWLFMTIGWQPLLVPGFISFPCSLRCSNLFCGTSPGHYCGYFCD